MMTKTTAAVALCLCAAFAVHGRTVKVSDFGYDPSDSTRFLQQALDCGAEKVILDRQSGPWITQPLKMRSHTELVFEPGVELLAKRGAYKGLRDYLLELPYCTNVTIRGGAGSTMRMWKKDYQGPDYKHGEWRYALRIFHCENVLVEGLTIVESGGDGIGVTGRNITIRNCVCDRNHRQGISVFNVENLLIEDCVLRGTSGTAPQSGIDFEPDHANEKLKNVVMRNCLSENNLGDGYQFYLGQLNSSSEDISVTLENCRSVGNSTGTWLDLGPGRHQAKPPKGFIRYVNCTFERARGNGIAVHGKPAGSVRAAFENCTVVNAATNGTSAAVHIGSSGGFDQPVTDDIRFDNLTVRLDEGREWLKCDRSLLSPDPVTNITGKARIVRNGGTEETVVFDAAWAERYMKPKTDKPLPKRVMPTQATWRNAKIVDEKPGQATDLPRIWFPYGAAYVFHVPTKGPVALTGRTRPSKARDANLYKPDSLKRAVKIQSITGGKVFTCDAPGEDGGRIAAVLPAAGFYTLSAKVTGGDFALESSCVPVAVDTRKGRGTMLFDGVRPATFWLNVPASGTVALVRGGTYSGSCANVAVFDASGEKVQQIVADGDWHALYLPDKSKPGLWRMEFSRIKGKPYSFYALDMAAQPALFFLSPAKRWLFADAPSCER